MCRPESPRRERHWKAWRLCRLVSPPLKTSMCGSIHSTSATMLNTKDCLARNNSLILLLGHIKKIPWGVRPCRRWIEPFFVLVAAIVSVGIRTFIRKLLTYAIPSFTVGAAEKLVKGVDKCGGKISHLFLSFHWSILKQFSFSFFLSVFYFLVHGSCCIPLFDCNQMLRELCIS
jgi:hypothetical protein